MTPSCNRVFRPSRSYGARCWETIRPCCSALVAPSQLRVQVQRLARYDVDLLRVLRAAGFANLDAVAAGAQVHRPGFVRGARVGAIDEHLGVLHFGVQLDFTGVGIYVVTAVARTPIRTVITAVIRAAKPHESADE